MQILKEHYIDTILKQTSKFGNRDVLKLRTSHNLWEITVLLREKSKHASPRQLETEDDI